VLEEQTKLRFLLLVLACLVLPHGLHLPWSHTLLFIGFWTWRWLGIGRPDLLPSGNWLPILTLTAASVVVVSQRGMIDLTTSTGLFIAGLGLKLMELRSERDLYFVVLLGWFVVLTQFLYDQSLGIALYALAAAALLTGVLVQFNGVGHLPWRALAQTVTGLLGPALPVAVGLFLVFPRPHGGFIHLPFDPRAKTGPAEILEPGAIAQLSTSQEVAFRVDFEDDPPPPEERYFRAQVFWHFDGRRWLPEPAMQQPLPQPLPGMGPSYLYHVTVEPHHRHWLFSLGFPASVPEGARLTREGLLTAPAPVEERLRYRLASFKSYRFPPLSPWERQLALQLPEAPSSKVQALVDRLRPPSGRPEDFALAVLHYFRDQGFRYTLSPGTLGDRPIEEFLFATRAGFCEHYAATFAYLMRVAGIPARIVGGYLGGFVNPRGRFLEVYQANAHAWVEIWIEGPGWVRVDPTVAVAPRYVEQVQDLADPLSAAIPPASEPAADSRSAAAQARADIWRKLVRSGLIFWSSLDHRWHVWVLSYDRQAQRLLLATLAERWPLLTVAALLALVGFKARSGGEPDPLLRAYRAFLQHMSRLGLTKTAQETPWDFARRAATRLPAEATRIHRITEAFIRGRYGRGSALEAAQEIRRLLREAMK
jgi:transglutaminase-like putative cysteine protease